MAGEFLTKELCHPSIESDSKEGALKELCDFAASNMQGAVSAEGLYGKVIRRELTGSTGVGDGVAIPHVMIEEVKSLTSVFGLSKGGVEYYAPDTKPVVFIFLIIGNLDKKGEMLGGLARAAKILKNEKFQREAGKAKDAATLCNLFFSYEATLT